MSFTKTDIQRARAVIEDALKEAGRIIGAEIEIGNIRYTENGFKTSLSATRLTSTGELAICPIKESKIRNLMITRSNALGVGSCKQFMNAKVQVCGLGTGTIIDVNTRAYKSPIIIQADRNGGKYRVPVQAIEVIE